MIYTGIGSRTTPTNILHKMQIYAGSLAYLDYTLRSGGAPGADSAFEEGCDEALGKKEIYLPWKNFQDNPSNLYDISDAALQTAAKYHPHWQHIKRPVKLLMGRNVYQVLGQNLDEPSDFVICWTPDGAASGTERSKKTGGTGQAIAIASAYNIPVFNLQREGAEEQLIEFLWERHNVQPPKIPTG